MNRRGDLFMLGLNIMFLIAIILIFWQLGNAFRPENSAEGLGTRQTAILRAYAVGENYFLAIDTAATLSVRDAYLPVLSRLAGCGSYAGYPSWSTPTQVCFPSADDIEQQYGAQIGQAMVGHLSRLGLPAIRYAFSYEQAQGRLIITGSTQDRIDIPIVTAKDAQQQRLAQIQQPQRSSEAFEKDTRLMASIDPSQVSRPRSQEAQRIVLQSTGMTKEEALTSYKQGTSSAHYLVDEQGAIIQLVDEQRMATVAPLCDAAGCEQMPEQDGIVIALVYPGSHLQPCLRDETESNGRCWPAYPQEQRNATQLLLGDILSRTSLMAASIVHRDAQSPGPAFPTDLSGAVKAQAAEDITPSEGETVADPAQDLLVVWPTESYTVTSCWGARPGIGDGFHDGIDMAGKGNKVFAFADGTVSEANRDAGGNGNNVVIAHDNGLFSRYSHLRDIDGDVKVGRRIARGARVGHIGNTGSVVASAGGDGSHLDFKIYTTEEWRAQYALARAKSAQEPGVNPFCYMPDSMLSQLTLTGKYCGQYAALSRDDPVLAAECANVPAPTQDTGCFVGTATASVSTGGNAKLTHTLANLKSQGYYDAVVSGVQEQGIDPNLAIAIIAQETCTTNERCGTADQISFTGCAGLGQFCYGTATGAPYDDIFGPGVRTWKCPGGGSCTARIAGCKESDPAKCDPRFDPYKSAQAISTLIKENMGPFAGKTDQVRFAIASYNGGGAIVRDAIKLTGKPDPAWEEVSPLLEKTGRTARYDEIRGYVDSVSTIYASGGGSFATGFSDQYCPDQQLTVKELGRYSITPSFTTSAPDLLTPAKDLATWARQAYAACTGQGDNRNCLAMQMRSDVPGIEFLSCSDIEGELAPLREFQSWYEDCTASPQRNCTCSYASNANTELRLTQGTPELYRNEELVSDRSQSRPVVRFAQSAGDTPQERTISLRNEDDELSIVPWKTPEEEEGADDPFSQAEDPIPVDGFLLYKGENGPVWIAEQGDVQACGAYKTQHRVCARVISPVRGQKATISFAMHLQDLHPPKPVSEAVAYAPTGWTDVVGAFLGQPVESMLTSATDQELTVSFLPSPSSDVSYYRLSCTLGGEPIIVEGRFGIDEVDGAIIDRIEATISCPGVLQQQVTIVPVDLAGQEGQSVTVIVQEEEAVDTAQLGEFVEQDLVEYPTMNFQQQADHIKEDQFRVLRLTEMPAVLVETFMLVNLEQQEFYARPENARGLAQAIGEGTVAYARHRGITKVIVENGHGTRDPGAVDPDTGKTEGQFTRVFWMELDTYLRAQGFEVLALNYDPSRHKGIHVRPDTGSSAQRQRIDYYAGAANAFGDPADSVYISLHADSVDIAKGRPSPRDPIMYIHSANGAAAGKYVASRQLAEQISASALAWYENTS